MNGRPSVFTSQVRSRNRLVLSLRPKFAPSCLFLWLHPAVARRAKLVSPLHLYPIGTDTFLSYLPPLFILPWPAWQFSCDGILSTDSLLTGLSLWFVGFETPLLPPTPN